MTRSESTQEDSVEPTEEPSAEPGFNTPVAPQLSCIQPDGEPIATAGNSIWSLRECAVTWTSPDVVSIDATIDPVANSGWEVMLVDPDDREHPESHQETPHQLTLRNADATSDGFVESRFLIASRMSCTAPDSIDLTIRLTVDTGADVTEHIQSTSLDGFPPAPPTIQTLSATFAPVDPASDAPGSTGEISLAYSGAVVACGWSVIVSIDDFTSGTGVIPAADLTLLSVDGPPDATTSQDRGVITLAVPPDPDTPASSTITLRVSVPVPQSIEGGEYTTTITSTATVP